MHVDEDIRTADKLPIDENLRNGRPVAVERMTRTVIVRHFERPESSHSFRVIRPNVEKTSQVSIPCILMQRVKVK